MMEYRDNEKKDPRAGILLPCMSHNYPIGTKQSLIQLYDSSLINELTKAKRFLTLANSDPNASTLTNGDEFNNSFSTGDYTISTTTIKNDTLNLPGPGIYHISSYFETRANRGLIQQVPGDSTNLVYTVQTPEGGGNVHYTAYTATLAYVGYAEDGIDNAIISNINFLYEAQELKPKISIYLRDFDFNRTIDHKVTVSNLNLIVQKLQDL